MEPLKGAVNGSRNVGIKLQLDPGLCWSDMVFGGLPEKNAGYCVVQPLSRAESFVWPPFVDQHHLYG